VHEYVRPRAADVAQALDNIANDPIRGPRLYVAQISMKDFRCFDSVSERLRYLGDDSGTRLPNVNLILGDNGAGKTTVLRAIAISAVGPILGSSGFAPDHLIRAGAPDASIRGQFIFDERREHRAPPKELTGDVQLRRTGDFEILETDYDEQSWGALFDESDLAFLVVGYGVNRRAASDDEDLTVWRRKRPRKRFQRVASLFDDAAVLVPLASWLPNKSPRRRNELEQLLSTLLPAGALLTRQTSSDATFRMGGIDVPFRALSDGYRSFISWVGDLIFQVDSARGDLPLDQVGGIVLVDEIDLLLHPSWQRDVVQRIAKAFPNLQFVFTSHSPIVAGTLEPANILVARSLENGCSELVRFDVDIHGLDSEQILLSSYFDLVSTRAPDKAAELYELAKRATHGDDEAAMQYLERLASRGATSTRSSE
jgi:hypothetical protein